MTAAPSWATVWPLLRPGYILGVGVEASVQFAGERGFAFRLIQVHDWDPPYGFLWLDGYQLGVDSRADGRFRRSILVQPAGLKLLRRR